MLGTILPVTGRSVARLLRSLSGLRRSAAAAVVAAALLDGVEEGRVEVVGQAVNHHLRPMKRSAGLW